MSVPHSVRWTCARAGRLRRRAAAAGDAARDLGVGLEHLREAEVRHLRAGPGSARPGGLRAARHDAVRAGVQQQVLGLEVAVDHAGGVEVLEGQRDLGRVEARDGLGERAARPQRPEELAAREVGHDQEEVGRRLEGAQQGHDVGVRLDPHQDVPLEPPDALRDLLPPQHLLGDGLHGVPRAGPLVRRQDDLAEGADADLPLEGEVAGLQRAARAAPFVGGRGRGRGRGVEGAPGEARGRRARHVDGVVDEAGLPRHVRGQHAEAEPRLAGHGLLPVSARVSSIGLAGVCAGSPLLIAPPNDCSAGLAQERRAGLPCFCTVFTAIPIALDWRFAFLQACRHP